MREAVATSGAPTPIGPYVQGVLAQGKLLFISGQIGLTPEGDMVAADIRSQTRQSLENIRAILASVGAGLEHVVKTTIFLRSLEDFPVVNEIYAGFFGVHPPARTTVEVSALPRGALVEIEAIAVLP
ncbi:MAG: Rid family detoxifying hydrolase [Candidatus Kapabacteria bacterium]|nr:Rid family detoxifying hydrolase [Candidatus Kapabacteria bacterium]MDW8225994.1 Rid family detoxifying hydrolase [Bacteroidota bacterium]